jgi:PilZ domain
VLESLSVYKIRLISFSGMLIETERRLDRDEVHEMEILPPGAEPIAFSGRVRSCLEIPESTPTRHEIGIEFLRMSQENRARLNDFMESTFLAPARRG